MSGGEHWFHTPEQMAFLDDWVRSSASGLREGDSVAAATLLGLL